jgi:hypothetical protein
MASPAVMPVDSLRSSSSALACSREQQTAHAHVGCAVLRIQGGRGLRPHRGWRQAGGGRWRAWALRLRCSGSSRSCLACTPAALWVSTRSKKRSAMSPGPCYICAAAAPAPTLPPPLPACCRGRGPGRPPATAAAPLFVSRRLVGCLDWVICRFCVQAATKVMTGGLPGHLGLRLVSYQDFQQMEDVKRGCRARTALHFVAQKAS